MAKKAEPVHLTPDARKRLYATRRTLPVAVQEETGLRFAVHVYFNDPSVVHSNPAAAIDDDFMVPWEPGITDGPTSSRFVVVDYVPSTGKLDEPAVGDAKTTTFRTQAGFDLRNAKSRTLPQFRQVSVWATVQHTLDFFEGALALVGGSNGDLMAIA